MEANRLGPLRILSVFVGLDLFLLVLVGMRVPWPALVLSGGVGLLLGLLACRYLRNTWDPVTLSSHAEDRPIRDTGIIVLMIFGLSMVGAIASGFLPITARTVIERVYQQLTANASVALVCVPNGPVIGRLEDAEW